MLSFRPRLVKIARPFSAGQSVVLFALAAVAAFAFIGLAIDGSNLHAQRRAMQNAADAAAFAGARALATGATNREVLAAVRQYAANNGADVDQTEAYYGSATTQLMAVPSDGNAPPANAAGVRVVAQRTVPVVFGFFLGSRQKIAAADAIVVFGPAGTMTFGTGIFPVVVHKDVVESASVGDELAIWDDNVVETWDDDGNHDSFGGDRGWTNLDFVFSDTDPNSRTVSTNHSNNKLRDWVLYGKNPPISITAGSLGGWDGDFINGDPGTRASSIAAAASRIGQTVLIPLYDHVEDRHDMEAHFSSYDSSFWANRSYYHVVGFAKFRLTSVKATGNPKWVKGEFVSSTGEGSLSDLSPSQQFLSDESPVVLALTDAWQGTTPTSSSSTSSSTSSTSSTTSSSTSSSGGSSTTSSGGSSTTSSGGSTSSSSSGGTSTPPGPNDPCPCGSGKKYKQCCSPAYG